MMRRLGTCRTFGENMAFMLNWASEFYFWAFYECISFFSLERVLTIIAWKSLFSRCSTLYFPPMGPRNTFTRTIYVSWWMFSYGNLLTLTSKTNRSASIILLLSILFWLSLFQLWNTYLSVLHPLLTKTQLRHICWQSEQGDIDTAAVPNKTKIRRCCCKLRTDSNHLRFKMHQCIGVCKPYTWR